MTEPVILHELENYIVLFKPAGWFVHSPDDKRAQIQFKDKILTTWFYKNFRKKYFPVHRLDFGTEGLLLWGKSREATGILSSLNRNGQFEKTYHAVVRGYLEPINGKIELPLFSQRFQVDQPSLTDYKTLKRLEFPVQINSPHPTSRYSLLEVRLQSGRWHQIRRHMDQIHHPVIGDQRHGDSHHNRYFRDDLKLPGLLLKAISLKFVDPWTGQPTEYLSPSTERWENVYRLCFQHPNYR